MAKTNISWATHVWNPVVGCSKVSSGCANCYAERMAHRLARMGRREYENVVDDDGRWTGEVEVVAKRLMEPLRWRSPRRVFVCSMGDLFHKNVPYETLERVFALAYLCPHVTFLVLTKRAKWMRDFMAYEHTPPRVTAQVWKVRPERKDHPELLDEHGYSLVDVPWPLPNVWLGVSVENQETADERIPLLLQTPAVVRWVSAEPMLSSIDLTIYLDDLNEHGWLQERLHLVICGAESGPDRRPFDVSWAEDLYDQCRAAGMPYWFKQGSGPRPGMRDELPEIGRVREWPGS